MPKKKKVDSRDLIPVPTSPRPAHEQVLEVDASPTNSEIEDVDLNGAFGIERMISTPLLNQAPQQKGKQKARRFG